VGNAKRGVLGRPAWQARLRASPGPAFDFGSIAISITGSGKLHLLENDLLLRIAQRVAGAHFLQSSQGHDVAREGLFDVLAIVGVHEQHAADPLLALLGGIDDTGAARHRAGNRCGKT